MIDLPRQNVHRRSHLRALLLSLLLLSWTRVLGVDVLTQANDNNRTGANLQETVLNTSNVNPNTFGKVFTYAVNGNVFAQPLYVSQVNFGGSIGVRNAVIIATENNYVYAFDADNQSVNGGGPQIWSQTPTLFGAAATNGNGGCGDLAPTVGITSTPVIDKVNGIIYLVAKSFDGTNYHDVMHALTLTTGAEQPNWPVEFAGTAGGATFNPQYHHCRPGLLMQNVGGVNTIYAALGSHCDQPLPSGNWYGWIFSVATGATPNINGIYCTCPTHGGGSIWASGKGIAADANGNIFFATGNTPNPGTITPPVAGAIDGTSTTTDKAMSVVKVNSSLQVQDFFIPANSLSDNGGDADLGSGGPLLIPGTNYLVQAGKIGNIYLLNTNGTPGTPTMGAYVPGPTDTTPHQWFSGIPNGQDGNAQCPVYWNAPAGPHVYYWCGFNVAKAFAFNGTLLGTTPDSQGSVTPVHRQGGISISANGSTAGTGILWGICSGASANSPDTADPTGLPGTIYAYNAEDLTQSFTATPGQGIWNSDMNTSGRDTLGSYSKLSFPTPANGRLYVPTRNYVITGGAVDTTNCAVVVYGLLAPWQTMATSLAISVQPSNTTGGVAITPPVQVKILDGNGNLVAGATNNVTISLGANPGGATLSGTLNVTAVGGIATFSNLIINNGGTGYTLVATSMPAAGAFTGTDIGAPAIVGSTTQVTGGFDVVGGGSDIQDPSDQFQFGHVTVSGNFDIQARVNAVFDTPPGGANPDYAKSGLMARATLPSATSDNALALVFPGNLPAHNLNTGGYEYQYRDNGVTTAIHPAGFTPSPNPIPVDFPAAWLRLTWNGTVFTGYTSVDGATWTQYVTSTPTIAADWSGTFSIGLAVTSHNVGSSSTAQFRNVSLNNVPYLNPATSSPFNVATAGIVATPVIAPPANRTYTGPVTVTMSDSTAGAAIYYTINGGTPTAASTLYNPAAPPVVTLNSTVQAIGIEAGLSNSAIAASTFTISGSAPYGMPTRPAITPITLPASLVTNPPALLSATGVFSDTATQTPAPGIVPYTVINPLWSDNATKNRYIALPPGGQITFAPTGEWSFPTGTVMIKTFLLNGVLLETRLILLTASGPNNGYGVTYKWLANGTDAQLMGPGSPAGLTDGMDETEAGGQVWHYPSRNECLACHNSNAGFLLGPKTRQINTNFAYPSTVSPPSITDNQLRTWNYLDMFTTDIGETNIAGFELLVPVTNTGTTAQITNQVRSYLDANCSYCHRPGGPSTTNWNGLYDTTQANMNLINVVPQKGNLGIPGALLIYPQNPPLSVLYDRVNSLNALYKMQPLAHNVIDPLAVPAIAQWINSLAADPAPTLNAPAFAPLSGPVGTSITISGANLMDTIQVSFNGTVTTAVVSNAGGTQLTLTVPAGATTGTVTVTTPSGSATSAGVFTVGAAGGPPTITTLFPTSGSVGSTIIISGTNLGGTSAVAFNGVAATFSVLSTIQVSATVPAGATTGLVSVTTAGGTATSPGTFTVVGPGLVPIITAISPASGPTGTVVIITGTNLGGITAVSFNGSYAAFSVNGAGTQITTTVPAGANSGTITVQGPQGIANSPTTFTNTTPPASGTNPSSATSGKCGYGFLTAVGMLLLVFVLRRMLLKLR